MSPWSKILSPPLRAKRVLAIRDVLIGFLMFNIAQRSSAASVTIEHPIQGGLIRRLVVTGILGACMALPATDAFPAQQVIIPESTVIEQRTDKPGQSAAKP